MGRFIIKAANDDSDLYCFWDTTVDCPVVWGTREELTEYEVEKAVKQRRSELQESFARADETGTSVRHDISKPLTGSWEDEELTVMENPFGDFHEPNWNSGTLDRSKLKEFLENEDRSLIKPFDWGDE